MENNENDYYDNPKILSYSGLNKLMFSPALYYKHYILNQREDVNSKYMIEGRAIHCLLLTPDKFFNEFIISLENIPTDSVKNVLHRLFNHYKELKENGGNQRNNLEDYQDAILDILKDENLYQSLKTDVQRLDKIVTTRNIEYWNYLISVENKTIIDKQTYLSCCNIIDSIKNDDNICKIMGINSNNDLLVSSSDNNIVVINEKVIITDLDDVSLFQIRTVIDNLVIDHTNKEIRINDLKKISDSITSFHPNSIEKYNLWLQAAIYYTVIDKYIKNNDTFKDYKLTFRFIVIDLYGQMAPIKISDITMTEWIRKSKIIFKKAEHHLNTKNFKLPYEFIINNNELTI